MGLIKRVVTSVVGLPVLIFFLYTGGLPLRLALLALALIGMNELYSALSGGNRIIHIVGYVFACVYYLFLDSLHNANEFVIIFIAFSLTIFVTVLMGRQKISIEDAAFTFFGFCYVAVLLSTVYLVSISRAGSFLVGIIFVTAWGCDTGAYLTGRTFGRHKLAPVISPKKTVEGAIGGTITGALLTMALGFAIIKTNEVDIARFILIYTVLGAACSVFSQLGDLFASVIKRQTGIKDFGKLLPGHGGVLDRFDSVLFTAPALYLLMLILIR